MNQTQKTVIVVGGGFGGVRCARDLAAKASKDTKVMLISNKSHLEYYGAIYKLIAGHDTRGISIPLSLIFKRSGVELAEDSIVSMDPAAKTLTGTSGKTYRYDVAVLALGAETNYFGIPGMKEHAMTFKSVHDALEIKRHLHTTISSVPQLPEGEKARATRFVVIGGGATGVEAASELSVQGRMLATRYGVDPSLITVDLIEALPRVMSLLPEDMSPKILKRLGSIGVNVRLQKSVERAEAKAVHLKDEVIETDTIVWTAGVKGHGFYATVPNMQTDKRGRSMVDDYLRARGLKDVYVIGDGAATQYSGMAQTAIRDAAYVADSIVLAERGEDPAPYVPAKPAVALPVGNDWAAVLYHGMRFYGRVGWLLRQAADVRACLLIMSPWTLIQVLRGKRS